MKARKYVLALLALAITFGASATKIPQMNIVALDESKAVFSAITDPNKRSEISIEDEAGNVVYYKKSKDSAGISSVFNLSKLKNGTYTFKVKSGTASAMREMVLNDGNMEVKELKKSLEPYFALDGNLLKLSYLNFNGENMSLVIYKGNRQVFESELGSHLVMQEGFNVSKLPRGDYDVVLTGENEYYSYRLGR